MKTINAAVLDSSKSLGKELGKKGSATDFTIYDYKEGEDILVCYEPSSYPAKIQPLLYSLNLADIVLIRFQNLDKEFGELCVAAECSGKKGFLLADDDSVFRGLTKGMGINTYERLESEPIELKKKLLSLELGKDSSKENTEIMVDNFFMVKSVGLVILGKVDRGKAEVHDKLTLLPAGKEIEIKSIQIHDKDVKECELGRLGAVLKGIEYEQMDKGSLIVADTSQFVCSDSVELEVSVSRFSKTGIEEGGVYYLSYGLQFVQAKASVAVKPGQSGKVRLNCDRKFAFRKGERVLLCNPNEAPRVIGWGN